MAYPASLDSFTSKTDGAAGDDVMAADVNELQAAIVAIETEMGTDPAGSLTDAKTRMAVSLDGSGNLALNPRNTKTISSGAITITGNLHLVETEGSAASDDLATINGGAAGRVLLLRTVNDARDVVIKHGSGNIYCSGAKDITLSASYEFAILFYDDANTRWLAGKCPPGYALEGNISGGGTIATGGFTLTVPASGTAALLATANVFTANQTLSDVDLVLGTTTGSKIGTDPAQKLAFYGDTPVVQPTALTAQSTAITHSAPGTPDYAIADLVDTGGFGFVTLDEGLSVLSVIANLQTRVAELETKLQSLGLVA